EPSDLVTNKSVGGRMIMRSLDLLDSAISDCYCEATRIRTIHRTVGRDNLGGHSHSLRKSLVGYALRTNRSKDLVGAQYYERAGMCSLNHALVCCTTWAKPSP